MIKKTAFFATLFCALVTLAETAEHAGLHEEGIPLDKIGWQAANLGILVIVLFYFSKKAIVDMFAKRKTDFIEQSAKTKSLLLQAEADLKEIKSKLTLLEGGESGALERAQHEANLIKANLINEAEAQSTKMKNDAEVSIRNELMKAKEEINQLILKEAISSAKQKLSVVNPQTQQAIEKQFLSQVDGAHATKDGL